MAFIGTGATYALVMIAGVYSSEVPTTIDTTLHFETQESCSEAKRKLEKGISKPLGNNGPDTNLLIQFYCVEGTLMQ